MRPPSSAFVLLWVSLTQFHTKSKMKVSTAAIVLAVASGASAYQQPTRSTLRSLGQKSVSGSGPSRNVGSSMKMEGEFMYSSCLVDHNIMGKEIIVGNSWFSYE